MKRLLVSVALIITAIVFVSRVTFAADNLPKYQIVAVSDQAYLLDIQTGFTWILTYRTTATGREPVAIPYKFIKISPANQKDFIVETQHGVSLLSNGGS